MAIWEHGNAWNWFIAMLSVIKEESVCWEGRGGREGRIPKMPGFQFNTVQGGRPLHTNDHAYSRVIIQCTEFISWDHFLKFKCACVPSTHMIRILWSQAFGVWVKCIHGNLCLRWYTCVPGLYHFRLQLRVQIMEYCSMHTQKSFHIENEMPGRMTLD